MNSACTKLLLLAAAGTFFSCPAANAQTTTPVAAAGMHHVQPGRPVFPDIKPVSINKKNEIEGFYNPKHEFATRFPNFLNNGRYLLDASYPGWDLTTFSSDQYPATIATSDKSFADRNILVTYGTLNPKDYFFQWAKNFKNSGVYYFAQQDQLACPDCYIITGEAQKRWADMNDFCQLQAGNYLRARTRGTVRMGPLGSFNYLNELPRRNTVILELRHDEFYVPDADRHNRYPAYHLFTLVARSPFGDSIASYRQVIFAMASSNGLGKGANIEIEFHNQAFTNAFPSLVSRFLNDTKAATQLDEFSRATQGLSADEFSRNAYYGALESRKRQLATICQQAALSFDQVSQDAADTASATYQYQPNSSVSAEMNQTLAAGNSVAGNLINRALDKAEARIADARAVFVRKEVDSFVAAELRFISELAALPPTPARNGLVEKMKRNSADLAFALNTISTAQARSATAMAAGKKTTAQLLDDLNRSVAAISTGSGAESAAIATGTPAGASRGGSCPQADQFAKTETARLKARRNSITQADILRVKAAVIRKYLSACPDAFTAQQRAAMEQTAAEIEQDASTLQRSGTPLRR